MADANSLIVRQRNGAMLPPAAFDHAADPGGECHWLIIPKGQKRLGTRADGRAQIVMLAK